MKIIPIEVTNMNFSRLVPFVPTSLMAMSGEVFYSGRAAFEMTSHAYLLGLNPGGDSSDSTLNTIEQSLLQTAKSHPMVFSRYLDEPWRPGGQHSQMQVRVKHLFDRVGLDPRATPSSNLVFARSRDASSINVEFEALAEQCWPLHREVISSQDIKIIICMGEKTFKYVAGKIGADRFWREYIETNQRRWRSVAFRNAHGMTVVRLTHPSRADWTAENSDPSELVRWCLDSHDL